jgi:hypothetical protein
LSVVYDCAAPGCRRFYCRNADAAEKLGKALEMTHDNPCQCTDEGDGGKFHACAECCAVTAKREEGNEVAQGWQAFLAHCAEHGGWKAYF